MIADIDLDHVAVAAEDQAEAWPRYAGELAGEWVGGGGTPGFWSAQVRYANGMKVEVLEPYLVEQNDFLRRFLDRNGPGPHHLTFKVKDIAAAIDELEAAGVTIVGTSDHTVTHSVYIVDPDGNEIELYIDVQPETWRDDPSAVIAPIKPLRL